MLRRCAGSTSKCMAWYEQTQPQNQELGRTDPVTRRRFFNRIKFLLSVIASLYIMSRTQNDERRPLLGDRRKSDAEDDTPTPLPKAQLGLLFFIRATDPICFNVIFPFINQMLLDIGAAKDATSVGYKAGLVSTVTARLMTGRIALLARSIIDHLPLGCSER